MKKAEEYIKPHLEYPEEDYSHNGFVMTRFEAIRDMINQARKDLIDEILRMREPVKWHEDGKERIKPVDIFKIKDQIE